MCSIVYLANEATKKQQRVRLFGNQSVFFVSILCSTRRELNVSGPHNRNQQHISSSAPPSLTYLCSIERRAGLTARLCLCVFVLACVILRGGRR